MFTGTVRLKICEACGLRPTDFQKRHSISFGKTEEQLIDPYVAINVDETYLDRTTIKTKTFDPVWNELFVHEVHKAKTIGLTVFHDAAIPPDDFVANCAISFAKLGDMVKETPDFWVGSLYHLSTSTPDKFPRSEAPSPDQVLSPLNLSLPEESSTNISNVGHFDLKNMTFSISVLDSL